MTHPKKPSIKNDSKKSREQNRGISTNPEKPWLFGPNNNANPEGAKRKSLAFKRTQLTHFFLDNAAIHWEDVLKTINEKALQDKDTRILSIILEHSLVKQPAGMASESKGESGTEPTRKQLNDIINS